MMVVGVSGMLVLIDIEYINDNVLMCINFGIRDLRKWIDVIVNYFTHSSELQ